MNINDTIVAIATSTSSIAALNIVRITGDKSFQILQKLIKRDVNKLEERKMYHFVLEYENKIIDDALIVLFKGKNSFCGEDTVEFNIHGSPLIAYRLIKILISLGARMARNGEFSFRSVINGKMNLIEAERINALIHAKTELGSEKLLSSFSKDYFKPIKKIKESVEYLYAYFLQVLDYPEEYNDEDEYVEGRIDGCLEIIDAIISGTRRNSYLFSGVKVVICGEPNVGKSTLLNRIVKEDRAIVTSIEGTTRDVISGEVEIRGVPFVFYDTAGIRKSDDLVESIGIKKSFEMIEKADLVLFLVDDESNDFEYDKELKEALKNKKVIKVQTKSDLVKNRLDDVDISIGNDSNIEELYDLIMTDLDLNDLSQPGLFSLQDLTNLESVKKALIKCKEDFSNEASYDLLTINLNEVYQRVKTLLGEDYDPNEIYDVVFKNFCVGK